MAVVKRRMMSREKALQRMSESLGQAHAGAVGNRCPWSKNLAVVVEQWCCMNNEFASESGAGTTSVGHATTYCRFVWEKCQAGQIGYESEAKSILSCVAASLGVAVLACRDV
jgi:hypothetical protein